MGKKGKIGNRFRKVKISHESLKKQNKRQYAKIITLAIFLLIITIGGSYALFSTVANGHKKVEIVSGTLEIEYKDNNVINLSKAVPLSNEEGLKTVPYTFNIHNVGTLDGKYTISLEEKDGNTLNKENIKYSIKEGDGEWSEPTLLSSGLVLVEDRILESEKDITYQIKMWLKEDAPNEVQGQSYSAKIVVDTVQSNATPIVTTNPIIKLQGESVVKVELGSEYVDAGVSSIDSSEDLKIENVQKKYEYYNGSTTETVDKIDTNKAGIYYIYYEISDSKGNKGVATRVVNVYKTDTNNPTISLRGNRIITLEYGQEYEEPGYDASDVEDGDLTSKVVVIGTVNEKVAGTYIIKYLVEDSSGNTASDTRQVIVNKKESLEISVTQEENKNINSKIKISATTTSDKVFYAIKTTNEKPNEDEYKEMSPLEEFTGSYYNEETIVKNGTYYIFIKDSEGNEKSEEITVSNIDQTKPTCRFEDGGYLEVNEEKQINLTCTDPADIAINSITTKDIEISNDTGSIKEIKEAVKVQDGYQYPIVVKANKAGTFTLKLLSNKISDFAGNLNDEVTSESIQVVEMNISNKQIKLDINGKTEEQIEVTGENLGTISYDSNNGAVATVTTTGVVKAVSPGVATISVTESNKGIKQEVEVTVVKTITAYFTKNGSGVIRSEKDRETCEIIDDTGKCKVTLPNIIVSEGYNAIGWNENKEAHDGHEIGTQVDISDNTVFYSISAKPIKIKFELNGAIKQTNEAGIEVEENVERNCNIYNDEANCSVKSPVITPSEATPNVLGYNEQADAKESSWAQDTVKTVTTNGTYYAITTNEDVTKTANFEQSGLGVTGIGDKTLNCVIKATYNGNSQAEYCKVTAPTIDVKDGYVAIGWNEEEDEKTGIAPGDEITLTKEITTFYSISKKKEVTLTAKFYKNGATSLDNQDIDPVVKTCKLKEVFNNEPPETECSITTPSIQASDLTPNVLGFSEDAEAISASIGAEEELTLKSDKNYYAITKQDIKEIEVRFHLNNAKTLDGEAEEVVTKKCNIEPSYNGEEQAKGCDITAPVIVGSDETPDVIGYSTSSDDYISTWESGAKQNVSSNGDYYAQTMHKATEKSVDFKIGKNSHVSKIENDSKIVNDTDDKITVKCTIEATHNGEEQADNCSVKSPKIYEETGYKNGFWGDSELAESGISSEEEVSSSVATYYARALTGNTYTINYYDDTELKSSQQATVGQSVKLQTAESMDFSKEGYTFTGWSTENGSDKKYSNGDTVTDFVTEDGGNISLYAVWKDQTAPVCSWTSPVPITTGDTTTLTLSCTDLGSGVASQNLSNTDFTVSSENGEVTNVENPVAISKGFKYTVTVKGLSVGTFTVSLNADVIKDNDNNLNKGQTSENITVNGKTYTVRYTSGSNISNIGKNQDSCVTEGSSLSCNINLPTITAETGYDVLGWYEDESHVGDAEQTISISQSKDYVAKAKATTYTVSYNNNGGEGSIDSQTATYGQEFTVASNTFTKTGHTYKGWTTDANGNDDSFGWTNFSGTWTFINGQKGIANNKLSLYARWQIDSHTVTYNYERNGGTDSTVKTATVNYNDPISLTPVATPRAGYTFVGWNTNPDETKAMQPMNMGTTDVTLYAIYKKNITITFHLNGAASQTPNGKAASTEEKVTESCTVYNLTDSCNIKSPTIKGTDATPTVRGYSTGSTRYENDWASNFEKTVSASDDYYAQTYKAAVTRSATFTAGANIKQIGSQKQSCTIDEIRNGNGGKVQSTECDITAPSITASEGYVVLGWFISTNSGNNPDAQANAKITLKADASYTAKSRIAIAAELGYDNTATGLTDSSGNKCTDVQCAIDALNRLIS